MNPELMQILLAAGAALAGYFLRHFRVALPGVVIPPTMPAVTPQVAPPASQTSPAQTLSTDTIVAQLLAHQMELIQKIGAANQGNAPAPAVSPLTSNAS